MRRFLTDRPAGKMPAAPYESRPSTAKQISAPNLEWSLGLLKELQGEFENRRPSRSSRGNESEVLFAPNSASLSADTILKLILKELIWI